MSAYTYIEQVAEPRPGQAWFDDARFGMFIHWGIYAVPAGGEWSIFRDRIPKHVYRGFADRFVADRFDPKAWAEQAARAGMKYVVFTTKHHDGFCMFDSKLTDWKVTETPLGRDVVAELAEAVRSVGLRFGVYYSIWDLWHEGLDGGLGQVDAEGNVVTDHRTDPEEPWTPSDEGVGYIHGQIEELLSNYGPIDVLWFDVPRADGKHYRGVELMRMIRRLQPDILVNDRLVKAGSGTIDPGMRPDIVTPENKIPPNGLLNDRGEPLRWESCMCHNEHWGYVRDDRTYKSAREVLCKLTEIASKGGNLLLNVGPNPRGEFPQPWTGDVLDGVGRWLERNGQSIYGTTPARLTMNGEPFHPWFVDSFKWQVAYTRKGDTLYAHCIRRSSDHKQLLPAFDGYTVEHVTLLDDGSNLPVTTGSYASRSTTEWTVQMPRHDDRDDELTTLMIALKPQV
ncbi:MAG: alpha-L-fucosidase [Planctomycetota bacterium]